MALKGRLVALEAGRVGRFSSLKKKFLKSFKRVLKSKKSLKS
jgi:hypothetical protein